MGNDLKQSKNPCTLKNLNELLKFSLRIAIAKCDIGSLEGCITSNRYPSSYWRALRRIRVCPNRRALKRHILNLIVDIKTTVSDFERFTSQRNEYICKLSDDIRTKFLDYVNCRSIKS